MEGMEAFEQFLRNHRPSTCDDEIQKRVFDVGLTRAHLKIHGRYPKIIDRDAFLRLGKNPAWSAQDNAAAAMKGLVCMATGEYCGVPIEDYLPLLPIGTNFGMSGTGIS